MLRIMGKCTSRHLFWYGGLRTMSPFYEEGKGGKYYRKKNIYAPHVTNVSERLGF